MNDLTLQDEAVLAATLDFIDSYESDSDPSPALTRNADLKRPRTTSGQRARAEIERLRGVVAELEAQVQHLKQRAYEGDGAMVDSSEFRAWEELVARERWERQRAQSQNIQLRELLIKQMLVVRKLEKLVNRGRGFQESSSLARQIMEDEQPQDPSSDHGVLQPHTGNS